MTPEQATEILQRVTRIETMCEGRCATAQESRGDLREELQRLRADMERGQDRLESKLDHAILSIADKQEQIKDAQWRDRLKSAGVMAGIGSGGGVIGSLLTMIAQHFFGGGK